MKFRFDIKSYYLGMFAMGVISLVIEYLGSGSCAL
jgi:hypothetical protein